ncbi:MAG TPA: alpha/beta fold hydrolase [Candidatus Polarisedimenticolia bacterium]|jgi:pimeloyl-ACP methyl ester carboxylesterase
MSFILGTLLAALLIAAACASSWPLIRRRYRLGTPADELHHARTEDGWDLALYRYLPLQAHPFREPVILCHGMLSNRFNVDLDERCSLARHLRARGFDVWVMELRGHGGSRRSADDRRSPERRGGFDWTLDDYILRDVPSVLRYVCQATGSPTVHWFGHSLGGMLLYGGCATGLAPSIRSAVVTDAPATLGPLRRRARGGRLYARLFPAVPPALVLPFLGPAAWLLPRVMARRYGMADRRLVVSLLANAIIPWGSSRVLLQLCRMLEQGRFASMDGEVDYELGALRIEFPLLVIAAGEGRLPEETIRHGIDRAPAREKRYLRLAGRTHSNLLVGPGASEEVYPVIADWFEAHSSG